MLWVLRIGYAWVIVYRGLFSAAGGEDENSKDEIGGIDENLKEGSEGINENAEEGIGLRRMKNRLFIFTTKILLNHLNCRII